MTPTAALQLAEAVVVDGFAAHRAELDALFASARRVGVSETLVAVAAGPAEPDVARLRALGRVVVAYTAARDAADDAGPASLPVLDLPGLDLPGLDLLDVVTSADIDDAPPADRALCSA